MTPRLNPRYEVPLLVLVYLAAIVAANLSVNHWGPKAAIYNAFLLIGLDFTTRDALHDAWNPYIIRNMSILIISGSLLTYVIGILLFDVNASRIAIASAVAFFAAGFTDAFTYHLFRFMPWYERVNRSNIFASAVDSLVFPVIAFSSFTFAVSFSLFTAKIAGGLVWSFVLARFRYAYRDSYQYSYISTAPTYGYNSTATTHRPYKGEE
jgi:uncharacterized PurR-regulated membrane protein YhhQ (DUF165 family)